jgi:hypothetical protein
MLLHTCQVDVKVRPPAVVFSALSHRQADAFFPRFPSRKRLRVLVTLPQPQAAARVARPCWARRGRGWRSGPWQQGVAAGEWCLVRTHKTPDGVQGLLAKMPVSAA